VAVNSLLAGAQSAKPALVASPTLTLGDRLAVRRCGAPCSAPSDEAPVDPPSLTGKDDLAPFAAIDHFDGAAS
jgi:hypothetical protein